MTSNVTHWIDGAELTGTGPTQPILNPATGEEIGTLQIGDAATVDQAVQAAAAAQKDWARASLSKRTQILYRMRDLVIAHTDEIAEVISRQHGKTVADAKGEIARGLETLEFATSITQDLKGGFSANISTDVDGHTTRQPLGVVAGITPFNFPAMVPFWMHPIAIATGNAFILKPSERDPEASNIVARLYQEAGLPDGVFQVVHGGKDVVDALCEHPGISAVSFVGSTPIAKHVHDTASAAGKRVQALGGANNHAVVMPDANIEFAAAQVAAGAFGSAGERCMAVPVAVTVGAAHDDFVTAITAEAEKITVGPGSDPATDMGPVITPEARQRVIDWTTEAEQAGAAVVVDGRDLVVPGHENGNFVGPIVLTDVPRDARAYKDEVFGPMLVVMHVDTLDEAIDLVNSSPYGNGTAIFTASGHAARRYQEEVQVGMIGVNVPIPTPVGYYSFGGWKDSLFGEHHAHGPEAVSFYTRQKAITTRWPEPDTRVAASMNFPTHD
ncbi:CoA-acylating methylmalonate-semialdehyde dehydrogenase [Micrococcus yunnanensis]|uniref:CoA-acylating methylmalonate-semialdehyde dehydrogenase n=1 Tax=Micrococcus TaxID=1269 RepID=UPI0008A3ADC0|nr:MULTISPECIES: CoA-acylating methylmalonate-semialdehyde dehydrogenase [Micrococcus]MBF0745055.1 CoA-acylating methylmalonate-semialdehyde dehydrogenase [Micrococcus yunnanensis]OFS13323.1 methylmalonate-semialdehyde dehydrogenase (acylating) [Micrococcus sp. HMSC31B01]TFU54890.1 CoA-acylating methylmalonate-semialdehyde dehydrogenase [Micrococcus yunnanensis]